MTSFRITGLSPEPFAEMFGLDDTSLAARRARRVRAADRPLPDRIGLRDLGPGETALLVNYLHQPAETPYRASHAVYVCEGATERYDAVNAVPAMLRSRILSLRAFDEAGMLVDADVVDGRGVETLIARLLAQPQVAYVHAHFAKHGCYAALITRA